MRVVESLALPTSYPWTITINAYECLMYLADLERISEERILKENELLYYAYLSFCKKAEIKKVWITDCRRYSKLLRLPFLYLLALFYEHGFCGLKKDLYKARKLYRILSDKGFKDATIPYYSLSIRLTHDERELNVIYQNLLREEKSISINRMIHYCQLCLQSTNTSKLPLQDLQNLEDSGDMKSSYYLGLYHIRRKEYSKAFSHFVISAEKGHRKSKMISGIFALKGIGIKQDSMLALSYFLDCDNNGFCLHEAAKLIARNKNLIQDSVIENFKEAYQKGYIKAGIPLCIYYLNTFGEYDKGKEIIRELETTYKSASHLVKRLFRNPTLTKEIQKLY